MCVLIDTCVSISKEYFVCGYALNIMLYILDFIVRMGVSSNL